MRKATPTTGTNLYQRNNGPCYYGTSRSNQSHSDVQIFLTRTKHTIRRAIHTFQPDDLVSGVVKIAVKDALLPHSQHKEKVTQILKEYMSKQIHFVELSMPLLPKGMLSCGIHEIPFSFSLQPTIASSLGRTAFSNTQEHQIKSSLSETFHGELILIQYNLHATISRGFLSRQLQCRLEIALEIPSSRQQVQQPCSFNITPCDILSFRDDRILGKSTNSKQSTTSAISMAHLTQLPPKFEIKVHFLSLNSDLRKPLNGTLIIGSCNWSIRSISVILYRMERICLFQRCHPCTDMPTEATVPLKESKTAIHRLQIVNGDVWRGTEIPFSIQLPNFLVTPSTTYRSDPFHAADRILQNATAGFQIHYEIGVKVMFANQLKAEKFLPISLFRG